MKPTFALVISAVLLAGLTIVGCPVSSEPDSSGDFSVSVATKTTHPYLGQGSTVGYVIDGVQGKTLDLVRGTTYTFTVMTPGHPFYITADAAGGPGFPGEVTTGVTNSQATSGSLSFTPDATHPDLLYYQCGVHESMGYQINISNP